MQHTPPYPMLTWAELYSNLGIDIPKIMKYVTWNEKLTKSSIILFPLFILAIVFGGNPGTTTYYVSNWITLFFVLSLMGQYFSSYWGTQYINQHIKPVWDDIVAPKVNDVLEQYKHIQQNQPLTLANINVQQLLYLHQQTLKEMDISGPAFFKRATWKKIPHFLQLALIIKEHTMSHTPPKPKWYQWWKKSSTT